MISNFEAQYKTKEAVSIKIISSINAIDEFYISVVMRPSINRGFSVWSSIGRPIHEEISDQSVVI